MLTDIEIRRKVVHLFVGVFIALFYYFGWLSWKLMLAVIIIGLAVSRHSIHHHVPVIDFILERLDRKQDRKSFPGKGAFFLFLGSFLAMVLFPKDVGVASIMILALGDSVAALLGPFGSIPHPVNKLKLIEGTIAGIIAGTIGAAVFVPLQQAFWASLIAMAIEALDVEFFKTKLDDNVMIPLISGIAIIALRGILG